MKLTLGNAVTAAHWFLERSLIMSVLYAAGPGVIVVGLPLSSSLQYGYVPNQLSVIFSTLWFTEFHFANSLL